MENHPNPLPEESLEEDLSAKEALGLSLRNFFMRRPVIALTISAFLLSLGCVLAVNIGKWILFSEKTETTTISQSPTPPKEPDQPLTAPPEIDLSLQGIELGSFLSNPDIFHEAFPTISWVQNIGKSRNTLAFQQEVKTLHELKRLLAIDLQAKLSIQTLEQRQETLSSYNEALGNTTQKGSRHLTKLRALSGQLQDRAVVLQSRYKQNIRALDADTPPTSTALQSIINTVSLDAHEYAIAQSRLETLQLIESKLFDLVSRGEKRSEAISLNYDALLHNIKVTEVEYSGLRFSNKSVQYNAGSLPWGRWTPISVTKPTSTIPVTTPPTQVSPLGNTSTLPPPIFNAQPVTFGLF